MEKVSFITDRVAITMEIGRRIRWMALEFYTILEVLSRTKENGKKINLMEKVSSTMIYPDPSTEISTTLTSTSWMMNGLNTKENSSRTQRKERAFSP